MRARAIGVLVVAFAVGVANAGGPRQIDDDGNPIKWNTSTPVTYYFDRGELGTLSNEAANDLVAGAFKTWESVPGAGIRFEIGGRLLEDIDGDTFQTSAFPAAGSGINPIVYDDDGSILRDEFGNGAEDLILGITLYGLPTTNLTQVTVIINGRCYDGDATLGSPCEVDFEELRGVVTHELGHFAGLDHTDLNRELINDGTCSNDSTTACTRDLDCTGGGVCVYRESNNAALPTMYPLKSEDDSTLASLHPDDELALARLYPAGTFPAGGGTVQGRVLESDGTTPFNGANVILRSLDSRYLVAASAVSGDVKPPGETSRDGFYRIEGVPQGNYTLEVRPVAAIFGVASSVGQWGRCENDLQAACRQDSDCTVGTCDDSPPQLGGPAEFLSLAETSNGTTDDIGQARVIRLVAGDEITTGLDFILNDLSTLTNDLAGAGNNDIFNATPVDPAGAVLGDRIEIGDVDYYEIYVPKGWTLRVDVDAMDGGLGSTLEAIVQLRIDGVLSATTIPDPATGLRGGVDPALEYIAAESENITVAISSIEDVAFDGADTGSGPYYLRLTPRAPVSGVQARLVAGGGRSDDGPATTTIAQGALPASLGSFAQSLTVTAEPFLPAEILVDEDGDGVSDGEDPCPLSGDRETAAGADTTCNTGDDNLQLYGTDTTCGTLDDLTGDGVCDDDDNCVDLYNPSQSDGDFDGAGDRCDPPDIAFTIPHKDAFGVPRDTTVRVKFSEPMDEVSLLVPGVVRLTDNVGATVPSDLSISHDDREATLDPQAGLAADASYTIVVETSVADKDTETLQFQLSSDFRTRLGVTETIPTSDIGPEYTGHTESGDNSGDRLGAAVAAGKDVNGDGFEDAVYGAPQANSGAGHVRLVFGKNKAIENGTTQKLVFVGETGGDLAGRSVAIVPDVNGDGIAELFIGAPQANPAADPGGRPGAAYLVFGDPGLSAIGGTVSLSTIDDVSCNPCGVIFAGENPDDQAGRSVSFAGDLNGDNLNDVMIGAPDADPFAGTGNERTGAGIVYVIYGGSSLDQKGSIDLADVGSTVPGVRLLGELDGDRVGHAISDWRDLTFDGRDDILIGAPGADVRLADDSGSLTDAGVVYALMGRDPAYSGDLDLRDVGEIPATAPGFLLIGAHQNGEVGFSVWGRGDVTGDGENDILIGAPGATYLTRSDSGEVYLVPSLKDEDPIKGEDEVPVDLVPGGSGTATSNSTLQNQLGVGVSLVQDRAGFVFGGLAGDNAGFSVATADDLTGDDIDEILIGAPGHDADIAEPSARMVTLTDSGRVYVVFGQSSRTPDDTGLEETSVNLSGLLIDGTVMLGRLGEAVTGTSDLDDSGTADLILGAPGDLTTPPDGGRVYITEPIVSTETRDLRFSVGVNVTLEWQATGGASDYAVYRGSLSDLTLNNRVQTTGTCINPSPSTVGDQDSDGRPDFVDNTNPAPGTGFWYQVAGTSTFGVGPIGSASDRQPRVNDETSCP